jgi:glucosamine-phosphate N-acetyltransferase
MSLNIRLAREEDSKEIVRILSQLSDCSQTIDYVAEMIIKYQEESNISRYVMEDDNKIVAIGNILFEQKISHSSFLAAHIEDVVVDKDYRRKGLGQELIAFLVEKAREAKAYKIILDCDRDKVSFYERCGFYENGVAMRLDIVSHSEGVETE